MAHVVWAIWYAFIMGYMIAYIGHIGNSVSETLCLRYNNIDLKHQKFIELGTGFDNFLDSDYVKT